MADGRFMPSQAFLRPFCEGRIGIKAPGIPPKSRARAGAGEFIPRRRRRLHISRA